MPIVAIHEVEMFGDPNLDSRIYEVEGKAERARHGLERAKGDVNELAKKVDDLSVVCQAHGAPSRAYVLHG